MLTEARIRASPCGHHGIGHRGLHPRDPRASASFRVGDSVDQDDELVLADDARPCRFRAPPPFDPMGGLGQHRVARVMAVSIVDRLEAIDVDIQEDDPVTGSPGPTEGDVESVEEQAPPGHAGQLVMGRPPAELVVIAFATVFRA